MRALQLAWSCEKAANSISGGEGFEFDFWRRRLRIRFLAEKAANSISSGEGCEFDFWQRRLRIRFLLNEFKRKDGERRKIGGKRELV